MSFLTARWHISTPDEFARAFQSFSREVPSEKNNRSRKKKNFACLFDLHAMFFADRGSMESQVKESLEMLTGYCILWGGARLQSRGVEGVTGCSGEGLHSRR